MLSSMRRSISSAHVSTIPPSLNNSTAARDPSDTPKQTVEINAATNKTERAMIHFFTVLSPFLQSRAAEAEPQEPGHHQEQQKAARKAQHAERDQKSDHRAPGDGGD